MKKCLKYLIREEIKRLILEQNKPDAAPPPDEPDVSAPETPTPDMDATAPDTELPDGDLELGEEPVGDLGDATDIEGSEGEDMFDVGFSGGGAGGGFSGSGGSFGGGGDFGDEGKSAEPGAEMPGTTVTPGPERRAEDPVGAAMDEAKKTAENTTDPQVILAALKSSIQVNFGSYDKAWPVVKQLIDTKDPLFRDVAGRLTTFLIGL